MTVRALDRFLLPAPPARGEAVPEGTALEDAAARNTAAAAAVHEAAAPRGLRLTAAQRELWARQARDPRGAAPVTAAYREIHGPLDPVLFAEALHRTVGETDALRMRIVDTPDGPRQRPIAIEPPGHGFPLCAADLRGQGYVMEEPVAVGRWPGSGKDREAGADQADDRRSTDGSTGGTGSCGGAGDSRGAGETDGPEDAEAVRTALAWMRADLDRGFGTADGPLFAYGLFRVGDRRWLWYRRVHRALLDAHGHRLVDLRVAEVYTALAAGEDPGPSPFGRLADLVAEEAAYRGSAARDRDRAYWRNRLAGLTADDSHEERPPAMAPGMAPGTPTGMPPRALLRTPPHTFSGAPAGFEADRPAPHDLRLDPEATAALRELAASVRGSWTGLLLAAHALHLCRTTGRHDVVLGLPLTGRTGPAALRVPGAVRNTVPLRLTVSPDATFADLVRQADVAVREARTHQRYRRADLRRDLGLPAAHPALTGPSTDVVPAGEPIAFAGARSTLHPLATTPAGPHEEVTVTFLGTADGGLRLVAETGRPAPAGRAASLRALHGLLTRLPGHDPHVPLSALSLVPDEEHERALREGNDTAVVLPPTTAIGPFEAYAARTPGATALVAGEERLTYGELNARANRLARHLATLGIRPGTFATVGLPPSVTSVVALLAVLKAGSACLFEAGGEGCDDDPPSHEPRKPHTTGEPYGEGLTPACVLTTLKAPPARLEEAGGARLEDGQQGHH
ncbi:condensation domain-containing protein, partial [Streptomyces sp. URMC 126]|uniref:condensation domain-containing protein n=1 Tax=Streptomyces sp. URMC 126 TaxID=3423401 RepID=UPI003F1A8EB2